MTYDKVVVCTTASFLFHSQTLHPVLHLAVLEGAREASPLEPGAFASDQLLQMVGAAAHTGAVGRGERDHRLAGEIIAFHEGIHGPSGNAPPDGIADEYGIIFFPVGGFGILQCHVPQTGVIMFLVDPGTFVVVVQVCRSIGFFQSSPNLCVNSFRS